MSGMSLDEFLGHSTGNARSTVLKNWKKRPSHSVDAWLHRSAPFACVWRHNMSRVVIKKEGGGKDVWGLNLTCWEREEVVKNQYKRLQNGEREIPPECCPMCKMLEWIHQAIENGDIDWTTPVFRFIGDVPQNNITYYAGGMTGAFGSRNITDEQKQELGKAGIHVRDAWKQVVQPKANYVMCVVDNDAPKDGVQVTIEPSLLGDKLRTEIRKALKSEGEEEGDPRKFPVVFQFQHDPDPKIEFGKKYDVTRISQKRIPLTTEIDRLISGPSPNVEFVTNPFDADTARMELEAHALIEMPWDDFFPAPRATVASVATATFFLIVIKSPFCAKVYILHSIFR